MWKKLVNIQKRIAPEAIIELLKRFDILKQIEKHQPIGRRTLSRQVNMTERVLRKEVETLQNLDLIHVDQKGISLTHEGIYVIEELGPFMPVLDRRNDLAEELKKHYNLHDFYVIRGDADESSEIHKGLSKLMAEIFMDALYDNAVVSVAGGSTMASVSDYLKPKYHGLMFVPARGGLGEEVSYQSNSIVSRLAAATGGEHRMLYAPDSVGDTALESLKSEPSVKEVTDLNKVSNFVIHGIGDAFTMAHRRHVDPAVIEKLKNQHAVGEAFGYYFDEKGQIVHKMKTIGIQLEDLASKECIFAAAGGSTKQEAVRAYMNLAPQNTVLFIDEAIAKYLLENI
jgi:central glycolytic genes regulator